MCQSKYLGSFAYSTLGEASAGEPCLKVSSSGMVEESRTKKSTKMTEKEKLTQGMGEGKRRKKTRSKKRVKMVVSGEENAKTQGISGWGIVRGVGSEESEFALTHC
ncbi:hypothetical protein AAMO2058_000319700 [Amorphochlora amoebiformis]